MALIRKNIQMSEQVADWYVKRSAEMGVSQSALMTMALKQYIDQEKAMSLMDNMKQVLADVQELKKSIPRGE